MAIISLTMTSRPLGGHSAPSSKPKLRKINLSVQYRWVDLPGPPNRCRLRALDVSDLVYPSLDEDNVREFRGREYHISRVADILFCVWCMTDLADSCFIEHIIVAKPLCPFNSMM